MAKIIEAPHQEKAVFVGVIKQNDDERQIMEYLDELEFLAETAGAVGVKKFIQKVDRPDSRTYIRSGKLQEIKEYCEENEIDRFEDFRVRTLVNKSAEKVSIILAVDRQVDLDEIAKTKGLSLSELLDEIYSIVDSGTKLNLDYYINEVMDDYHMQDIYDYFREAENNDIDEALDEFADDEDEYTEEEIKLVRIKFLAENGH